MDWMVFPLLYLDWIPNIQIEEGRFQKIFCLILSNLNPFQLRLLYYHFPSFPGDWKVIDQQFTTFQLFKKYQNTELCCLWYPILNYFRVFDNFEFADYLNLPIDAENYIWV